MFALKLFGGASIEGPDGPLTGRAAQRHRLALLALLATAPRGLTRDKLIAFLWPERSADRARHSLSDSIYRINKALDTDAVIAAGDELRLDPKRLPSDVRRFREAMEREDWEGAIELYSGLFLDGFHLTGAGAFERWVDGERQRFGRRYAGALESVAEERADAGNLTGAAEAWRRRAASDPYDSRVATRLMEALEAAGNRAGALRHARTHAKLLEQEFGTRPDPRVTALAERLRSQATADPEASTSAVSDQEKSAGARENAGLAGDPAPPEPAETPEPAGTSAEDPRRGAPGAADRFRPAWLRPPPRGAALGGMLLLFLVGTWFAWKSMNGTSSSSPPPAPGIAVLPFESLSPDEQNRFFADGVMEDILTHLARIGDLRVIARASVMPYREGDTPVSEIGEELGVGYILQGSVRRAGERVRINAQLVDAGTNVQIWAENYDRRLEDVFAVQSEIATVVAEALEAELAPSVAERIDRAPTHDLEAYNLYLRGRYSWHRRTEESLLESARFFERAVERDSSYARAWAGLADAYSVLAFYDYLPPNTAYPRAREAATRALAIDEELAEAHASLGYITLYHGWDAGRAEAEFRRAIELNPSYSVAHQWYANLLVATGRFDEAARAMSRAREVNPLSLIANGALGWVHYYAGRYEEAVRQCERALEVDADWDLGHLWRGLALEELGRTEEAIASLRRAVELSGGSGITVAALAQTRARSGADGEARELLEQLLDAGEDGSYQPSFEIAKVHLALEQQDEALRWLEHAYEERSHSMVFLEVDPQLTPLRSEPRFRRLLERVGLEG